VRFLRRHQEPHPRAVREDTRRDGSGEATGLWRGRDSTFFRWRAPSRLAAVRVLQRRPAWPSEARRRQTTGTDYAFTRPSTSGSDGDPRQRSRDSRRLGVNGSWCSVKARTATLLDAGASSQASRHGLVALSCGTRVDRPVGWRWLQTTGQPTSVVECGTCESGTPEGAPLSRAAFRRSRPARPRSPRRRRGSRRVGCPALPRRRRAAAARSCGVRR